MDLMVAKIEIDLGLSMDDWCKSKQDNEENKNNSLSHSRQLVLKNSNRQAVIWGGCILLLQHRDVMVKWPQITTCQASEDIYG